MALTEDYCSKEITDLLKEKGFKCGATYSKGFVKDGDGFVGGLVRHEDKVTHQMVMKWLREKGLFIEIHIGELGDSFLYFITIQNEYGVWGADSKVIGSPAKVDFPTYEEAVEAALKYCLTKLI